MDPKTHTEADAIPVYLPDGRVITLADWHAGITGSPASWRKS